MARKKKQTGADIDWYLISIDRLKKIGLGLFIVLLAAGSYLYYFHSQTPEQRAQNTIRDAETSLNELAGSKEFNSFRTEFERAKGKIDQARSLFAAQKFPEAESAAIESQTITKTVLARVPGQGDSDAQFLTVEGEVEYQKSNSSDWKKADPRTALFNGDWVKTSGASSTELIFSNGSLYTVGPNALLEIYAVFNPATKQKDNSVQMQVGQIEVNTTDDTSLIKTPGTRVVVNSDSTSQVAVDGVAKSTAIFSIRGSASVAPSAGGAPVTLASGEQVTGSKDGEISEKAPILASPALESPGESQVFQVSGDLKIDFGWGVNAQAKAYQFQASRSRLFSSLEINARKTTTKARARITSEGIFYWRVASVDAQGRLGPYSQFRRFRVAGSGSTAVAGPAGNGDKTPPAIQVSRPRPLGGQYYLVEGKVEPGAQVFVNEEEVSVESDGSFRKLVSFAKVGLNTVIVKAVDSAGNQSVQRENVYVEE
ncbi:MAG TPA: hypothetical protein VHL58_19885 [Thermoanaerobaculia bacterium]|nr:hypothetical protein [Thermoanaerobaculia bacterium]